MYSSNPRINDSLTLLRTVEGLDTSSNRASLKKLKGDQLEMVASFLLYLHKVQALTPESFNTLILYKDRYSYTDAQVQNFFEKARINLAAKAFKIVVKANLLNNENYAFIHAVGNAFYLQDLEQALTQLQAVSYLDKERLATLLNKPTEILTLLSYWLEEEKVLRELYDKIRFIFLYNGEFLRNRLKYSPFGGDEVTVFEETYLVPHRASLLINKLLEQNPEHAADKNLKALLSIELPNKPNSWRSGKTVDLFSIIYAAVAEKKKNFSDLKAIKKVLTDINAFMQAHDKRYEWVQSYKNYVAAKTPQVVIYILQECLALTKEQSTALVDLISFEGHWEIKLLHIRKAFDVVKHVHEICQKYWLENSKHVAHAERLPINVPAVYYKFKQALSLDSQEITLAQFNDENPQQINSFLNAIAVYVNEKYSQASKATAERFHAQLDEDKLQYLMLELKILYEITQCFDPEKRLTNVTLISTPLSTPASTPTSSPRGSNSSRFFSALAAPQTPIMPQANGITHHTVVPR